MKVTLLLIALFLFSSSEQADSQWIQSKGSLRENVSCLAVSGTNLIAGTYSGGGVYLSTDSGVSWGRLGYSLVNTRINALAVSDSNFIAATDNGLYLSTNKGLNWTQGAITVGVNALLISGTTLFAGANEGVYLSTNNGITWTKTSLSKVSVSSLAVSGLNIFAGSGNGIFRSTDNGKSWAQTNFYYGTFVTSLTVAGTNLFAVADYFGVYRSSDNGTTWVQIDSGLTGNNIKALAVLDTNLVAGTTSGGFFLSTNYGKGWRRVNSSAPISYINSIGVLGSNFFTGTSTGVFRSINNGTTWTQDNELPLNSDVFAIDFLGKNIIAGAYRSNANEVGGGVFFSSDYGLHWTPTNLIHQTVWALAVQETTVFVGTDSGVFHSTDNGTNWTQSGLKSRQVNTIAVSGTNLYAGTDSGMFLSTDNGISWTQKVASIHVLSFAVSLGNLYVGTDKGFFVSIDNGKSWTKTGLAQYEVRALAVLGTYLFAGTPHGTGGIHLSTDNGLSWNMVNTGLPNNGNVNVISLAVSGANVFIGTVTHGVFLSSDTGRSWKNMDLYSDVHALAIKGTQIYAGNGSSVWRRPLSEMIRNGVRTTTDENRPCTLEQNIPNPFDATTKITFDLESSAFVSLKVLDMLGREVSVLAYEELPAGSYTRNWNASAFGPGEYFYRLQAGAYSETKKLMLIK